MSQSLSWGRSCTLAPISHSCVTYNVGGSNYCCTAARHMGLAAVDSVVYLVGTDYDNGTKTYTLLSDPYAIYMAHSSK